MITPTTVRVNGSLYKQLLYFSVKNVREIESLKNDMKAHESFIGGMFGNTFPVNRTSLKELKEAILLNNYDDITTLAANGITYDIVDIEELFPGGPPESLMEINLFGSNHYEIPPKFVKHIKHNYGKITTGNVIPRSGGMDVDEDMGDIGGGGGGGGWGGGGDSGSSDSGSGDSGSSDSGSDVELAVKKRKSKRVRGKATKKRKNQKGGRKGKGVRGRKTVGRRRRK
jgi:uncharacterized membrane protein YgcG